MDLLVLDKDLDAICVIDTYTSLIWTDRYYKAGDFELCFPASKEILEFIKQDYYLYNKESEHVMIIEQIMIETDTEDGNKLTISGRSLESILDRRVVWGLKTLSGSFQNGIESLLNDCIISPSKPTRQITNFIFEASEDTAITDLTLEAQYTGDNLYDVISKACEERGVGFKVILNDNKQFVFSLYSGLDRSYDQTELPFVVFSPNFDNLISSNYLETKSGLKNVTLVGGEGEGQARRYTAVGDVLGLDRREMFTDARDLSSDVSEDITNLFSFSEYASTVWSLSSDQGYGESNFNSSTADVSMYIGRTVRMTIPTYTNSKRYATVILDSNMKRISTVQEWEGYDTAGKGSLKTYEFVIPQNAKYIFTSMFSQVAIDNEVYYGEVGDFECSLIKLSNDEYTIQMRQRGAKDLSDNSEIVSFEGEADTTSMYVYGKDFFNGDIVQVTDEYGHEIATRVVEIVVSDNEEGYSVYPTFLTVSKLTGGDGNVILCTAEITKEVSGYITYSTLVIHVPSSMSDTAMTLNFTMPDSFTVGGIFSRGINIQFSNGTIVEKVPPYNLQTGESITWAGSATGGEDTSVTFPKGHSMYCIYDPSSGRLNISVPDGL